MCRQRARTLAALFSAGAFVSLLVVVLPGGEGMDRASLLVTVVMAGTVAVLLALLADRVGAACYHLALASGTGLIATCQVLAGGGVPTAAYALLYVWVALHVSLYGRPVVVGAHLLGTTAAQAGSLLHLGEVEWLGPQLVTTLGTQLATVLVVGPLAQRLQRQARTDPLTGLANRRVAHEALASALVRSRRRRSDGCCVIMLDLDGFKSYNDRHGHAVGDQALVEAAARWRTLLRGEDTLARIGGDEFLLVLPGCDGSRGQELADRLRLRLPDGLACSAGVACWDGTESSAQLLSRADVALYAAKGRRGVGASSPSTATPAGTTSSDSTTSR